MSVMETKGVDCRKCRHYYITWDKKFPYGCRAMGFKSGHTPSLDVVNASGTVCMRFEEKQDPSVSGGPDGSKGQV